MDMSKIVDSETLQATVGSIREGVDGRIRDSRTSLAKIDTATNKILPEHLPAPVIDFSKVDKLSKNLTIQPQSIMGDVEVIYYSQNKTFVALKDGKYYNNWDTRADYMASTGGKPYADRLFRSTYDGELYLFMSDNILRPVTSFGDYIPRTEIEYMTADEAKAMVAKYF